MNAFEIAFKQKYNIDTDEDLFYFCVRHVLDDTLYLTDGEKMLLKNIVDSTGSYSEVKTDNILFSIIEVMKYNMLGDKIEITNIPIVDTTVPVYMYNGKANIFNERFTINSGAFEGSDDIIIIVNNYFIIADVSVGKYYIDGKVRNIISIPYTGYSNVGTNDTDLIYVVRKLLLYDEDSVFRLFLRTEDCVVSKYIREHVIVSVKLMDDFISEKYLRRMGIESFIGNFSHKGCDMSPAVRCLFSWGVFLVNDVSRYNVLSPDELNSVVTIPKRVYMHCTSYGYLVDKNRVAISVDTDNSSILIYFIKEKYLIVMKGIGI